MSVVVAFIYDGDVWMGCDSVTVCDNLVSCRENPKMFRIGEMIVGGVGQTRAADVLRFCMEVPDKADDMDGYAYLVKEFIPALKKALSKHGVIDGIAGEVESSFLVGMKDKSRGVSQGRVFYIGGNFAVDEVRYGAEGSGGAVVLGALAVTHGHEPRERIKAVLEASALHTSTVLGPFVIETI